MNKDIENTYTDEYGVVYNEDRTILLKAPLDIEEYTIPDGVEVVGRPFYKEEYSAFSECTQLKSIVFSDSVEFIDWWAFSDCSSLTNIVFSSSLEHIAGRSFEGCTSLKEIKLPDKLTFIDHGAFSDCSSLESIIFPPSMEFIEFEAFDGCDSLKYVQLYSSCKLSTYVFPEETKLDIIQV